MTPFTVSVHNGSVAHFRHTSAVNAEVYDNITLTFAFNKQTVNGKTLSSLPVQVIVRALKNCKFLSPGCPGMPNPYGNNRSYIGGVDGNNPRAPLATLLLRSGIETGDGGDSVWFDVFYSGFSPGGPNVGLASVLAAWDVSPNVVSGSANETPLFLAAAAGNPMLVSVILSAGANVNQTITQNTKPFDSGPTYTAAYTPLDAANAGGPERYNGADKAAVRVLLKANNARCNLNCRSGDTNLQGVVQQ